MKLITLSMWAKRVYEKPPHRKTLYRWIREAKIVPAPKRQGRDYYLEEDARYQDWNDLSGSEETQRG